MNQEDIYATHTYTLIKYTLQLLGRGSCSFKLVNVQFNYSHYEVKLRSLLTYIAFSMRE